MPTDIQDAPVLNIPKHKLKTSFYYSPCFVLLTLWCKYSTVVILCLKSDQHYKLNNDDHDDDEDTPSRAMSTGSQWHRFTLCPQFLWAIEAVIQWQCN